MAYNNQGNGRNGSGNGRGGYSKGGNNGQKSSYSRSGGNSGGKGGYNSGKPSYGAKRDEDVVSFRDGQPVTRGNRFGSNERGYNRGGKPSGGYGDGERKQYGGETGNNRGGYNRGGKPSGGYGDGERKQYGGENGNNRGGYNRGGKPSGGYGDGERKQYGGENGNNRGGYNRGSKPSGGYGDGGYRSAPRDTASGYENKGERMPKRGPRNRPLEQNNGYRGFERDESYQGKPGGYDRNSGFKPNYGYTRDNNQGYRGKSEGGYGERKQFNRSEKPWEKRDDRRDTRVDNKSIREPQRENPAAPEGQQDELPYLIMGRNAVREAIKSGRSIDRILVVKEPDGSLREIISLARDANIQLREVDKQKLDELCMPFGHGTKSGNHQGIVAQVPGVEYCDISDILTLAKKRGEKPFIIVLDGIEDPHNLGSIIRSAVCAGAHGIIIPNRRSASVTAAACKAAAGATEHCLVARVSNVNGAIKRLKDENIWIAGADMQGETMQKAKLEGALALIIGSEGDGLSRLTKDSCDFLVKIPMKGPLDSLNASVAAAVLMFEKRRQDAN